MLDEDAGSLDDVFDICTKRELHQIKAWFTAIIYKHKYYWSILSTLLRWLTENGIDTYITCYSHHYVCDSKGIKTPHFDYWVISICITNNIIS